MNCIKSKCFFWVFLFLNIFTAHGQTNTDSLIAILNKTTNDTLYVDILNKLSNLQTQSDPLASLDYAIKAEKIAQTCNYIEGRAMAYFNIGNLYALKGNNELAIENYGNSLKIYQLINQKNSIANAYSKIGIIYSYLEQLDMALDFHNKSLSLKKELHDSIGIAMENEYLGLIYFKQGKYDKALINLYNSLRLKESQNDKYAMAQTYKHIGNIYFTIESYDQAQVNFERSLQYFEQIQDDMGISITSLFLGDIYALQKLYVKAQQAYKQSLDINTETNNLNGIADANLRMGRVYISIQKPYLAYDSFIASLTNYEKSQNIKGIVLSRQALGNYYYSFNDFENAHSQVSKALLLAQKSAFLPEEYELLKLLAEIYLRQENYYKTSSTLIKANVLSDSLWQTELTNKLSHLKMQFEFEKKMQQKELEALRLNFVRQLKTQKTTILKIVGLVSITIITLLGFLFYKNWLLIKTKNNTIEEQKKQLAESLMLINEQESKLQKAHQTKDKFMSIIGNNLRNPFNTINSFVAQISDPSLNLDEKTNEKYLQIIKDASSDSVSLLENLMDWAKFQSGLMETCKENVQLNYVLRGNILYIKELARQKNVRLIEELVENPSVYIDKNMINSVVRNLLSNALKFTEPGGTIWIKTLINNNEIKVLIQDTGRGISEEMLSNIFEPEIAKKTLNGIAPSGLGLILCKDFLQQHRQELRVDSKLDFGSTFWFYLPLSV